MVSEWMAGLTMDEWNRPQWRNTVNEQQALSRMIAPGTRRPGKYRDGVIQIHVTRACDKACFNCTQGSNYAGRLHFIAPEQFEVAVASLASYWGVVGMFGGNPAIHPQFVGLCEILAKYIPKEQCGIWCNNPLGHGAVMREYFNPAVSNLNVHLDAKAYSAFMRDWPECGPVGLTVDSRHSPVYVALSDVVADPAERWSLISDCDINKHWSAMVGMFRGEARAWFCEIAGAQAMLHQDEEDYPDTGYDPAKMYTVAGRELLWWELPMAAFAGQVEKHCHECGVPLRGHGALAQGREDVEHEAVSAVHSAVAVPKRRGRGVELTVLRPPQMLARMTDYLGNARK